MIRFISILGVLLIVTAACKTNRSISSKPTHKGDGEVYAEICEPMTFTDKPFSEIESDYYMVDSLFITGSCLNIWVSYSGGCGDSDFTLYNNNLVMESMPPKANLLLKLSDRDNCRATVQQKLTYNINFFDNYAENGGIRIRLAGIGKEVLYQH